MIDSLINGRLVRDPTVWTATTGSPYVQFLLSVSTGEADTQIVSAIAFDGSVVERIGKLKKGDALAVAGGLKQTEWTDRNTNLLKHGLSMTVNQSLSLYDIRKRKKPADSPAPSAHGNNPQPFNDPLDF